MKAFVAATMLLVSLMMMPGVMADDTGGEDTNGTLSMGVDTVTVHAGDVADIALSLDGCAAGISEYNISLTLENESVAEWVGVDYPSWVSSSDASIVPASSVVLNTEGFCITYEGGDPVLLATLQVQGITPGESSVAVVVHRIVDGNSTVMDVEAVSGVIMVNESINIPPVDDPPVDNPPVDDPPVVDPEDSGDEYWYTFNATKYVSLGSLKTGSNEGVVSFEIDTNDPNMTAVEITVSDASELNRGFFVSGDHMLPLPLQVKGGNVTEYQNLNCTGVVITYPVIGNASVGFTIDTLYLNQPVPNLVDIVDDNYRISLECDAVFL